MTSDFENSVIGLDGSLTGFGVVSANKIEDTLTSQTLKTKMYGPERLMTLRDKVSSILSLNGSAVIAIEAYPPSPAASNLFQMGQLHGIIEVLLYSEQRSYLYVTPQQVKKYATGKASSSKGQLAVAAYKQWNLDAEKMDDNQIDAFILAKIANDWVNYKSGVPVGTKERLEVVKAVDKYTAEHYPWDYIRLQERFI